MPISIIFRYSLIHPKSTCNRYAHGNDVAARIAHDYFVLGKDTKLPIVPPEWYRTMEDALKRNRAETT